MVQKILLKIKGWWRNHIIDVIPPHLEDIFDSDKNDSIELWECATCGSRSVCEHCKIHNTL